MKNLTSQELARQYTCTQLSKAAAEFKAQAEKLNNERDFSGAEIALRMMHLLDTALAIRLKC